MSLGFAALALISMPSMSEKTTTRYYSWAELKQFPPRPARLQTREWAEEQERGGKSHYIADFSEDGRILTLTKRLDRKVFFRYEYLYEGGKLNAVRLIDQEGNARLIPQ